MKNSKKQTIEAVAKILLSNRIEFQYEQEHLKVYDQTVRYDLFQTATYHSTTGNLVLMDEEYKEVTFDAFLTYFSIYKKK